jgi:PAS domain S-box-containing protein
MGTGGGEGEPGLLRDLRALRTLGRAMAEQAGRLSTEIATLHRRRETLQGLCLDADPRVPPLWLLLDNMRNLVLRRAYRDHASGQLVMRFYGADAAALVGEHYALPRAADEAWYRRIHPADRAAYLANEDRRERCCDGYTIEYRYTHAGSGEFHWAHESAATPYRASAGHWFLDSCILDVTAQKRTEEALRASEQHYRAVVEDQCEYIRRFDTHFRLTFVNSALCRLLRKTREELLGANLLDLLPGAAANQVRRRLSSLSSAYPTVSYELEVIGADGLRGWQDWTDRDPGRPPTAAETEIVEPGSTGLPSSLP